MTKTQAWEGFCSEIRRAQDILAAQMNTGATDAAHQEVLASALPNLLEQCRRITLNSPRPMRSIHHFASTGGTLICRCLAAMPNTQLLSEVDPLSTFGPRPTFVPTDLIGLAQHGSRPPQQDVLVDIFLAGLRVLSDEAHYRGLDMILRDHTHSHFCIKDAVPERPSLRDMLMPHYALLSLVSVRHPLASYLSVQKLGWVQIIPDTLEEYAQRYLAFLDRYDGVQIVRYENFVADPETEIQRMCEVLDLQYHPDFRQVFEAFSLSGDSGRSGGDIAPRPYRAIPEKIKAELENSPSYEALCTRLEYDPVLS